MSTSFSGPEFLDLHKTQDFQVSLITFGKGENIPLHNHPTMTDVMTCIKGELQVAEFDLVEEHSTSDITLRSLGTHAISRGDVGTLTAKSRNIHSVQAARPSQLIDIFTPSYDPLRVLETEWYSVLATFTAPKGTLLSAQRMTR